MSTPTPTQLEVLVKLRDGWRIYPARTGIHRGREHARLSIDTLLAMKRGGWLQRVECSHKGANWQETGEVYRWEEWKATQKACDYVHDNTVANV